MSFFRDDDAPAAVISPCGLYRYTLRRGASMCADDVVNFIMLNPSTADADNDDPTIRRCVGFARSWGYGDLVVTNLFAFRSTDPAALKSAADPVGPENDAHILAQAVRSSTVVCAWGAHGSLHGRAAAVRKLLAMAGVPLSCLAMTKGGEPGHPLFLKGDLVTVPLEGAGQ